MDPVSLIVSALVAGAAAGGQGAAKDAVLSLYARLREALIGHAPDSPAAGKTLQRHAENPPGYEHPVRDLVLESGAAQDAAVLDLARQLLAAADPAQLGRYNMRIEGSQGVQVGEHNQQTNHFG